MIDPASLIVALLIASDEDIIRRLASRRICDACAITQSIQDDEDRDGCPYCGGNLVAAPGRSSRHRPPPALDLCGSSPRR